jgi:hypothetical protein
VRLSSEDRSILVKAALLLVAVRLGLWLLPFQTLLRVVARERTPTGALQAADAALIRKVSRYVSAASRLIPAASCLTQALTIKVMLARLGQPATLRIGVVKSDDGRLKAHAWVESDGRILIGEGGDLSRYAVLPPVEIET